MNITSDNLSHGSLDWSLDSQNLAFVTIRCNTGTDCHLFIDVYNISGTLTSYQTDIVGLPDPVNQPKRDICLLRWSPNNKKIVFRANCNSSPYNYQELHLLDLDAKTNTRLTEYTRLPESSEDLTTYSAIQTVQWFDPDTVLVGGFVELILPLAEVRNSLSLTEVYNLRSDTDSILIDNAFITGWTPNLVTGEMAVSKITRNGDAEVRTTHIISYSNNTLTVVQDLPTGCRFQWDSTGRYLAYLQMEDVLNCAGPALGIVFYDSQTKQVTSIPQNELGLDVVFVGWAVAPQLSSTPTTTSLPTSTNTYTATLVVSPSVTNTYTLTPTNTPTLSDLRAKLTQCVTDKGLLNSLTTKLDKQNYNPFINEVQAQRGKKITVQCADEMIILATYLRDHPTPTPTRSPSRTRTPRP